MKSFYTFLILALTLLTASCMGRPQYTTEDMYGLSPHCRHETTIAVYSKDGMHTFPGCADYDYEPQAETVFVERDFPQVPNNKYDANQVIMENLNTRVLAYCRGSEEEIEACVAVLEDSCYVRITEIPHMAAKYDFLKTGTYPTRRWRNGENVPRW